MPSPTNAAAPYDRTKAQVVDRREVFPHDATKVVQPPPIPSNKYQSGAVADTQYVTGHRGIFFAQYIKALSNYIDDLTADLGDDIYDRMMKDEQVDSSMRVLKAGILSEEGKIVPAITDEKHPKYELAGKVAAFVEHCIKRLALPLTCTLYEMIDAFAYGHKTAEVIYETINYSETKEDGTQEEARKRWAFKAIRTKARNSTAFLVDAYMETIGVLAQVPGLPFPILSGQLVSDPASIQNLLPRSKFFIFTHDPKNSDPRGSSGLRSSYTPWWDKQQTVGEKFKYLATYATPSLWCTTPADAMPKPQFDLDGNPVIDPLTGAQKEITPQAEMANTVSEIRNGKVIGAAAGSTINPIPVQPSTGALVYLQNIDACNRAIAKGILAQTLATEEGEHMARAASEVHMSILELGLRYIKKALSAAVKNDLFRVLVEFNFGKEAAAELTPDYVLSDMSRADWAMWSQVAVNLFSSGYMTIEQKDFVDKKLGLPKVTITDDDEQLDGNIPAKYIVEKLLAMMQLQIQSQQAQMEAQAQAQAGQQQGQVPEGYANPNHPANAPTSKASPAAGPSNNQQAPQQGQQVPVPQPA